MRMASASSSSVKRRMLPAAIRCSKAPFAAAPGSAGCAEPNFTAS